MVKHYILEKESDGKVRAFMYVERFHLGRLWSYKAIKEEIKLLHKILLRLGDSISKSEFAKNLTGFVEYQRGVNGGPGGTSSKSARQSVPGALRGRASEDNEETKGLLLEDEAEQSPGDDLAGPAKLAASDQKDEPLTGPAGKRSVISGSIQDEQADKLTKEVD